MVVILRMMIETGFLLLKVVDVGGDTPNVVTH